MRKQYRKFRQVECIDCKKQWLKRDDTLLVWRNRCKPCAIKYRMNQPINIEKSRIWALGIIKRFNNHIPNAKHFTSEKVRGSANPNWRGGITSTNQKLRHSLKAVNWRKSVFERDNYTCQFCFKQGGELEADHLMPFAYFERVRFDLLNGRTLCKDCHKKTSTYQKRLKLTANWSIT